MDIESGFITYLFPVWYALVFVVVLSEGVEQLKRKVDGLMRESEELKRFRKDIDWLKSLQKKVVKDRFD